MKQAFRIVTVFLAMAAFAFVPPAHNLVGKWITYGPDGSIAYVIFGADGTFKVTSTDGKIAHQGNYKLDDKDVFSINDKDGCGNDYWGKYQFTFVGNDSLNTSLIEDSCSGRRQDLTTGNLGIKRVTMK